MRQHKAWSVLLGCCLLQISITGIANNTIGMYLTDIRESLAISAAETTGFISLRTIVTALATPFVIRFYRKLSIKPLLGVVTLLYLVSYVALTFVRSASGLYAVGIALGVFGSFLLITPSTLIINNWFDSQIGTAMGLGVATSGIGGAVMSLASSGLIRNFGWRCSIWATCVIAALIAFFAIFVLIVYQPSDVGLLPYHEDEERQSPGCRKLQKRSTASLSPFYTKLLIPVMGCLGVLLYLSSQCGHIIPSYANSIGFSVVIGGTMSSLVMMGNVCSKLLVGWCYDRFDDTVVTLCFVLVVIASLLGLLSAGSALVISICSFFFGMSMSFYTVSMPYLLRATYGSVGYAKRYSRFVLTGSLMSSLYFVLVGISFDRFGSYKPAFSLLLIGYGIALLLLIIRRFCLVKGEMGNA